MSLGNAFAKVQAMLTGENAMLTNSDEGPLQLSLGTADFRLTYVDPSSYPRCCVFVEAVDAEHGELAQEATSTFAASSRLEAVVSHLAQAVGCPAIAQLLHTSSQHDTVEHCDGESEAEDEYDDDGMLLAEYLSDGGTDGEVGLLDMEIAVSQQRSRWTAKEQQQAQVDAFNIALTDSEKQAHRQQFFSSRESFNMLCKELEDLLRGQVEGVIAEAVGDDVHEWQVDMYPSAFAGSQLEKDLELLGRRHGVSSVRLHLSFKRGLYPFYPPAVRVVGPRLRGPLHLAITSHAAIAWSTWTPTRTVIHVLEAMRQLLQDHAQVNFDSEGTVQYAGGTAAAYSALETAVCALESLHAATPVWAGLDKFAAWASAYKQLSANDHGTAESMVADKPSVTATDAELGRLHMKAGAAAAGGLLELVGSQVGRPSKQPKLELVGSSSGRPSNQWKGEGAAWAKGIGYGSGHITDKRHIDFEAIEAAQLERDAVTCRTMQYLLRALQDQPAAAATEASHPPITSASEPATRRSVGQVHIGPEELDSLRWSSFYPWLRRELHVASFSDMTARQSFYEQLLAVVESLAQHQQTVALLHSAATGDHSFVEVMKQLDAQARVYLKARTALEAQQAGELPGDASQLPAEGTEGAVAAADSLATRITELAARVCMLAPLCNVQHDAASTSAPDPDGEYTSVLQPLQLLFVETISHYVFATEPEASGGPTKAGIQKLSKELASLKVDLPLNRNSSVFLRVNDSNMAQWRALITGPCDTPYANGCFIFDIRFPAQYPHAPPHMKLLTTGGGRVRFNPNLYNCGKVCLSLLGTWQGAVDEKWTEHSTMLQVLVSIQSLILVEEPYFNEPGFQHSMHTANIAIRSRDYNQVIREACMRYAMLDILRKPPPELADVVKHHFRLRKAQVVATCLEWIREASGSQQITMRSLLADIEQAIAAL